MPYRGLGSGIIRALQEESNIKFINEPAGMQFISIIDRIADEGVNEDEGINELESLILTFLEKKPGAKGYEIAEYIQKGAATTERYLRSLKDKELIEYKGSRKTGGYYKKYHETSNPIHLLACPSFRLRRKKQEFFCNRSRRSNPFALCRKPQPVCNRRLYHCPPAQSLGYDPDTAYLRLG